MNPHIVLNFHLPSGGAETAASASSDAGAGLPKPDAASTAVVASAYAGSGEMAGILPSPLQFLGQNDAGAARSMLPVPDSGVGSGAADRASASATGLPTPLEHAGVALQPRAPGALPQPMDFPEQAAARAGMPDDRPPPSASAGTPAPSTAEAPGNLENEERNAARGKR